MKEKLILTDADGVLVDWISRFDEWMLERGHPRLPDTDHVYNLGDCFGLTHSEVITFTKQYNRSKEMTRLKPCKDAQEGIAELVSHGFRFICITSLGNNDMVKEYRSENLRNLFGDVFDDVICLPTGMGKEFALEPWADTGYWWIEDHFSNAETGHEQGLKSVIIDTPYNAHYHTDLFPRVDREKPWSEIVPMILKDYNLDK